MVEDYANVGAFSGVHQFCRVGRHAFIGGYSVVTKDALPFAKTVGNRARIYGINTIGLIRRRFSPDAIAKLRRAYRHLLHSNTSRALAQIERDPTLQCDEVRYVRRFHSHVEPRRRPSTAEPQARRSHGRIMQANDQLKVNGRQILGMLLLACVVAGCDDE